MNPTISKKNQNFHKLDYVCFNKIKSIPKKNIISKKSFNNLSISNYNNSIEIDAKLHSKYRKINRHSQQKPILSERIKRNYSNGNKKGQNNSGTHIEQNSIYKINNTEMNSYNNLLGITNITLSPQTNRKNRNDDVKNIFDKNIIINNNNYDKKIIFLGDNEYKNYKYRYNDDKNVGLTQSNNEIYPYENDIIYSNSKTIIDNSTKNPYFQYSKKKFKNNLSLNLSDPLSNNYNLKSLKNMNNSKNKNIIKENENLKAELNKFLKENINLKIKMNALQKNKKNLEIKDINNINISNISNNLFLKNKKKKNLSFKKNIKKEVNEEDNEDSYYTKTCNPEENKNKKNEKTNHTFNSIYDSMKFKIQKRKFSNNMVNVNNLNNLNNINGNNSISLNNGDINYNKLLLFKNGYNKTNETNFGIEKSIENLKKSNNSINNNNSNLKYNGGEINNINYNNSFEVKALKDAITNLQKENEKLRMTNEEYKQIPKVMY